MSIKICVDCKFHFMGFSGDRCMHPSVLGEINIVTGHKSNKSCADCRADLCGCGPEGTNFKKKLF